MTETASLPPFVVHLVLSAMLFAFAYIFVSKRWLWWVAASIFFLNMLSGATYWAVDRMTGAGFNDAALYHVMNARSEVGQLWTYPETRWGLLALVVALIVVWLAVSKVKLRGWLSLSHPSQILLVLVTGAFTLYTAPLTADVLYTANATGLTQTDEIGMDAILLANDKPITPLIGAPKKNLIVIYGESLEQSLFDEKLFPGLLPELNQLATTAVRVQNINSAPWATWTIAGMIASQCGVPLSSHRLRNEANDFGKFASSGVPCLTRHLPQGEYHKVYMGGARLEFAGKGDYYGVMGFDEILGFDELRKPNSPESKWGLYDDELLNTVLNKLHDLRGEEKPFALFALNLDTHSPMGHYSPECERRKVVYGDGSNIQLTNVRCDGQLLAEFMAKVIEENLHDSTIVLLSDHLMMGGQANDALVERNAPRKNMILIWDKDQEPRVIDRPSNQFDSAATLIHAFTGHDFAVGFGHSLLGSQQTLTEKEGADRLDESITAWRTKSWSNW